MRVIAALFGPYAPDALTAYVSVFSYDFKRFERLTKLATSSAETITHSQEVHGPPLTLGGDRPPVPQTQRTAPAAARHRRAHVVQPQDGRGLVQGQVAPHPGRAYGCCPFVP
jgi:hypothetical protein